MKSIKMKSNLSKILKIGSLFVDFCFSLPDFPFTRTYTNFVNAIPLTSTKQFSMRNLSVDQSRVNEPCHEKTCLQGGVSDQVLHRPCRKATEGV